MEVNKKIGIIVQARLNSSRLPGKVLKKISNNLTTLDVLIHRLKKSKICKYLIFAIPLEDKNTNLDQLLSKYKLPIYYGSEKNVLSRYFKAAKKYKLKNIVRITSDCPLIDHKLLDRMITKYFTNNYDYLSNTLTPTYPDGFDIEIFKFSVLKKAFLQAKKKFELEHVTPYIKNFTKFRKFNYENNNDFSHLRLTLDTSRDLNNIRNIVKYFNNINFGLKDIEKLPNNIQNKLIMHRKKKISQDLQMWNEAKQFIPDGNNFFSKRPELFETSKWPIYYKKAKGCYIWDQNNTKFIDLSLMGVGTNIMGYANKNINKAVMKKINNSTVSTLNSLEEMELAKKLVRLHPWSSKVKFARTGGEANLIALRIARAFNNKRKVVFCGYHGWHDWYLSNNFKKKTNLNEHLFEDLKIDGVLRNFKNLTYSFRYNDFESFKEILNKDKDICAVIMEVKRNIEPKKNFLNKIKKLCKKNNIILIFDECTSGFRCNYGGLHLKYDVQPDIAVFGKAIGNGYAINAILGTDKVMEASKKTFISSTFWSEGVGFAAALKTLEEMKRLKPWIYIEKQGKKIKKFWKKMSIKYNQPILISGLDAMPNFKFKKNNDVKKLYLIEYFLNKRILTANTIYLSISHTDQIIKKYFNLFENLFKELEQIDISKIKKQFKNIKKSKELMRLN